MIKLKAIMAYLLIGQVGKVDVVRANVSQACKNLGKGSHNVVFTISGTVMATIIFKSHISSNVYFLRIYDCQAPY